MIIDTFYLKELMTRTHLSQQERRILYKRTRKSVPVYKNLGLCLLFKYYSNLPGIIGTNEWIEGLPEFALFQPPPEYDKIVFNNWGRWWNRDDEGCLQRLIALDLMILILNDTR